ncbi:MAG: hypothetical protein ACK5IP_09905 [Paracoccus sp. (in: a-proteobacteria)]
MSKRKASPIAWVMGKAMTASARQAETALKMAPRVPTCLLR